MSTVTVKGIRMRAFHGYHDAEREQGNDFEVDLSFDCDITLAGTSDDLSATTDYAAAAAIVQLVFDAEPVKLIETLCINTGNALWKAFGQVSRLEVTVRKLHPPMQPPAASAEVKQVWQR